MLSEKEKINEFEGFPFSLSNYIKQTNMVKKLKLYLFSQKVKESINPYKYFVVDAFSGQKKIIKLV